jgi:hypothetical protein
LLPFHVCDPAPGAAGHLSRHQSVGNKIVFNLVEFVLVIIILVFIFIDFGFDIEELVTAFAPTLSAVAL